MVHYAAAVTAALLGLAASVSAGSIHGHHANLHKKSAGSSPHVVYVVPEPANTTTTCGCTTYTTTWYGAPTLGPSKPTTTSVPPPPAPTTTSKSKSAPPSSTSVAPSSTSVASTSTSVAPSSTYVAPPPAKPSAPAHEHESPSGSSGNGGGKGGAGTISPNGNQWAMTYTPYAPDGSCKSAEAVSKDVGAMKAKGFTTVRIYATDCSGLEHVGAAARQYGMKIIVGIYIDASGLSGGYEQIEVIVAWGKSNWDIVEIVVVGNEAVFQGFCSAPELAGFIVHVKAELRGAHYTGPVTTTEPLSTIQQYASTFCPVIDVVAANLHPFFNGAYSAAQAGELVAKQYDDLAAACDHKKEAYNLETGWPSQGNANGLAVPGYAEQKLAIESIVAKLGSKSAIFSYQDDTWKAPGDLGIERYWGASSLFSG